MADFRSQRMPSPDGQGIAKGRLEKAWDSYYRAVRPVTDPLSKRLAPLLMPMARGATFDLLGFWISWHMLGGFEGLQTHLGMSRSAVYRRIALFRKVFGEHPDVYRFPGIVLDVESFLQAEPPSEAEHAG
ncbi:hypothetical protein [Cryobacterium sp. 10I5]|uniref:hypothetical protein n=1 Tax=Cryobacterium sp. 10I5 TaxID=3048581 RepID=UPI002B23C1BB|nr:hypothetical protein [Cryobacterium sp. 10I5]MEB0267693.1 hypothetical protein [Cryobacterium sp. 10I5]